MKSTRVVNCLIIFLLLGYHTLLGSDTTIPLKPGDKVPDIFWNTVINYNKGTLRLSDFRGKKIIIDVWHRWCASCITAFPYAESLQEQYRDQLIILTVTSDKLEDYRDARRRSKILQESGLPGVINDTNLVKLLNPAFYPFYAWIDEKGVLVATTSWSGLTKERVKSFVQGELAGLDVGTAYHKADTGDVNKLFRIRERKREFEGIVYYSSLEKEDPKIVHNSTRVLKSSLPGEGIQYLDQPLARLYGGAFLIAEQDIITFDPGLKELLRPADEKDKERMEKWENTNVYSYQIRFPPESVAKVDRGRTTLYIQRDLQDYTGIKAEKKQVEREVFVLTVGNGGRLFSKPSDTAVSIAERTVKGVFVQNGKMDSFSYILETVLNTGGIDFMPLVDETEIARKVSIDLTLGSDISIESVNKLLQPYGLHVGKAKRKIQSLVLSR